MLVWRLEIVGLWETGLVLCQIASWDCLRHAIASFIGYNMVA